MTLAELTAGWGVEHQLATIGAQVSRLEDAMLNAVRANAKDRFRELDALHADLHEDIAQLLMFWRGTEQ